MKVVKEFLQSSTIHGLTHIATTDKLARLFWMFVVMSGFITAAMMIQKSYAGWWENPISTTVDYRPITDLPFPLVTVCPPRNTFTSLNLALRSVENRTLDAEAQEELTRQLPEIIFDSDFDGNFATFSRATNLSGGWYSGDTRITFLLPSNKSEKESLMTVMYSTSALAGTVSSPFFKQPYEADIFERMIRFRIGFDKPKNATLTTNIELKLEFDTDKKKYWEEVVIGSGHYKNGWFQMDYNEENANKNSWSLIGKKEEILKQIEEPTNFTHKFPFGSPKGDRDPYLFVEFTRRMTAEDVSRWKATRNTGIKLSWSYDEPELQPDHKYRDDNKDFIKLANILHSENNKDQLWGEIKLQRNKNLEKVSYIYLFGDKEDFCIGDYLRNDEAKKILIEGLFSSLPGGVPNTPDHEASITAETLAEAQKMFYYVTRCPNFYETALNLNDLFSQLINSGFPLKTVMVTLTRMIVTALQKKRENELFATLKGALKKFDKPASTSAI